MHTIGKRPAISVSALAAQPTLTRPHRAARIAILLGSLVACAAAQPTRAQSPPTAPFSLKEIGPHGGAAIAAEPGDAGGSAGFVIGHDAVLVIDTFGNPSGSVEAPKQLLGEIRKRTQLPIRFVVNTHYHADHVGGNGVFAEAGAAVMAHRNVRTWIHAENLRIVGPDPKSDFKAFAERLGAPTFGFEQGVDVFLGSRKIEVRTFPGHTGGDSVIRIPDANVVFAGDLFWRDLLPNLVDASLTPWVESLISLEKSGSTFVPGHGEVGTAREVRAFRDYLSALRTLVADARQGGKSGDDLVNGVLPALKDKYGQWGWFEYLA